MKLTNKQILDLEKFAKKNRKHLTHITDKSKLSTEDKFKIGLCKHFVQFALSNDLKASDLAKLIKVPKTRMSEMMNYKINKFKVGKLLEHLTELAKHDDQVREYVEFLNKAIDMPIPKVATSKRLIKQVVGVSLTF